MSSKTAPHSVGTRSRRSLAARLTASYALSSFLVLVAFAAVPYVVLSRNLQDQDQQLLRERVALVQSILKSHPDSRRALRQEVENEWESDSGRRFLGRVWDENGNILAETRGMAGLLPASLSPPLARGEYTRMRGRNGRAVGAFSSAIVLPPRWVRAPSAPEAERSEIPSGAKPTEPEAPRLAVAEVASTRAPALPPSPTSIWVSGETRLVEVALDLADRESFLAGYRRLLWLMVGVSAAVSALLGYLFARRAIRPLSDITRAVLGTQASTLGSRLDLAGLPSELSVLASAYNEMLERLSASFERLSRFSADIAHELRTPLNNILGQGDVALRRARSADEYRETLDSCLEEARRVSRIIDSLLFLARTEDSATELRADTIDLAREIEQVREFYAAAAEASQVALRTDLEGPVRARVDRTLFQRALANLIENALRATGPGGSITLSARAVDGGRVARIDVSDSGAGIAAEHLPHVFDRFYRPDSARTASRGGVGLGLAIVRSIAVLHGGTATIESEPGKGTRVALHLPAAAACVAMTEPGSAPATAPVPAV